MVAELGGAADIAALQAEAASEDPVENKVLDLEDDAAELAADDEALGSSSSDS